MVKPSFISLLLLNLRIRTWQEVKSSFLFLPSFETLKLEHVNRVFLGFWVVVDLLCSRRSYKHGGLDFSLPIPTDPAHHQNIGMPFLFLLHTFFLFKISRIRVRVCDLETMIGRLG